MQDCSIHPTPLVASRELPIACDARSSTCPLTGIDWYEAILFANLVSRAERRTPCYRAAGCVGMWWKPRLSGDDDSDIAVRVGATCNAVYVLSGCDGYQLRTQGGVAHSVLPSPPVSPSHLEWAVQSDAPGDATHDTPWRPASPLLLDARGAQVPFEPSRRRTDTVLSVWRWP